MKNLSLSRRKFLFLSLLVALQTRGLFSQKKQPNSGKRGKVLVLGAGISGLAAGRELQNQGFEVQILEARDRIGGRIHTKKDWGYAMDLGASWIHGINQNPITEIAKQAGLKTFATDYEKLEFWSEGKEFGLFSKLRSAWEYASLEDQMESLSETLENDKSLWELYTKLEKNLPPSRKPLIDWFLLTHESNMAENLERISAISFFKEAELMKGDEVIFEKGYEGITNYLASGLDIQLNQIVLQVEQKNPEVSVRTTQGKFQADFCVVTVPLGVLQRGAIKFTPELSTAKKQALRNLGMGTLNKLYAEFEEPIWDSSTVSLGIRPEKRDFRFFLSLYPFFKKPTLIGFLPGDFGREAESLTESALRKLLIERMSREMGKSIPTPKRIHLTRWNSDPFSYGSYSFFPVGSTGKDMITLGEKEGKRLFFAGEHTTPKYYGYVHGGYLSGVRAAEEILQALA